MKRASLEEIRRMKQANELFHNPDAREGESLGADFWAKADIQAPAKRRSVHLKLDPEVFDFFFEQSHGKGHLTRMQNVLKAYVRAHKPA
ncbi:BrnA antitoxin family protein [Xanthobacter sp. V4C-4]|uniref:BrnA antitoxin family protein n=1 Tax=Xanthobacter cornucopiae TaxID=3119924 RepID=UPI00372946A2